MTPREKELVRQIRMLKQQRDLLLETVSLHLAEGKPITLKDAVAIIKSSAMSQKGTVEHAFGLEAELRKLDPPKEPVNRLRLDRNRGE
jgi:hypothetical protein